MSDIFKYRIDVSFYSTGDHRDQLWVEDDRTYGAMADAENRGEHILKGKYTAAKRFKVVKVRPVFRLYSFIGDPGVAVEFDLHSAALSQQRHLEKLYDKNRYEVFEEWKEMDEIDESPDEPGQATD